MFVSGWLEPPVSPSDSWRSGTPSPPLSDNPAGSWLSTSDEGIVMDEDFDDIPKKKKAVSLSWYSRCKTYPFQALPMILSVFSPQLSWTKFTIALPDNPIFLFFIFLIFRICWTGYFQTKTAVYTRTLFTTVIVLALTRFLTTVRRPKSISLCT